MLEKQSPFSSWWSCEINQKKPAGPFRREQYTWPCNGGLKRGHAGFLRTVSRNIAQPKGVVLTPHKNS